MRASVRPCTLAAPQPPDSITLMVCLLSECLYAVKFQTLQGPGDRQHEGCLVLQGKTVFKWRTSASLVMNDVDQNCTLVSSKMFWNESDERNVIREVSS